MAVTAALVGGAMVAGGTASAVRAMRMKTAARGVKYGGSADATQGYREMYANGADSGGRVLGGGLQSLGRAASTADQLGQRGTAIMDSAGQVIPQAMNREGAAILGAYQPGAVAAAQTQQVLDQNAAANLGAARSSGALGLRNALNANATSGVQAAQGLAVLRAQEEQALMQAKVQQANMDEQTRLGLGDAAQQQRMQLLGLGANVAQGSNAQVLGAAGQTAQLGLAREGQYLNQLQDVERAQLTADMDYERRRQEDAQRRSNNLWGLGSALIGGGAKALGGAGG